MIKEKINHAQLTADLVLKVCKLCIRDDTLQKYAESIKLENSLCFECFKNTYTEPFYNMCVECNSIKN